MEDSDTSDGLPVMGVSITAQPTDGDHSVSWIQVLTSSEIRRKVYVNGVNGATRSEDSNQYDKVDSDPNWQLFGDFWYQHQSGGTLVDVPYSDIGNDVDSYTRVDKFTDYLYVQGKNFEDCPVPVARVKWGWYGAVERIDGVLELVDHTDPDIQVTPYNQYPAIPTDHVVQ